MPISKNEWDALTPDEQWQYIQLSEQHEAELTRLLNLFECPVHGQGCIPYAIAEVKRMQNTRPIELKITGRDIEQIKQKLEGLKDNSIVAVSPYDGLSYGYLEKDA